jgi:adenylate cyclase
MTDPRTCAVLFVDISGSTRLYEALGDAEALQQINGCLRLLLDATDQHGGQLVKHTGDGLMCKFGDADSALRAAEAMQTTVLEMCASGLKLGVRVGCHYGEVIESDGDLFGDAVNVAARMAEVAEVGEIIATEMLVERLSAPLRKNVRRLDPVSVRGKREAVPILQYVWEGWDGLTTIATAQAAGHHALLGIVFDGQQSFFDGRDGTVLVLGRDTACGVTVANREASRRHATIERRGDKFMLIDHSSNGTYVAYDDAEICLKREELILPRRGRIALGQSTSDESVRWVAFFVQR